MLGKMYYISWAARAQALCYSRYLSTEEVSVELEWVAGALL